MASDRRQILRTYLTCREGNLDENNRKEHFVIDSDIGKKLLSIFIMFGTKNYY